MDRPHITYSQYFDDLTCSVPYLCILSCTSRCNCIPISTVSTVAIDRCDESREQRALNASFPIPAICRSPSRKTALLMPSHPFQVDEVFRSIVEELVVLSPSSVLSLALCCKSLTDLSLSVLWEQQKRLSTLIKVLPPDAWTYEETDSPAGELVGHTHLYDSGSTLNPLAL